ncbi:MAG: MarR family transcriptional regulator, partial [Frankiales bacterium]|nr:MarR family transcriptional regulator [Frankiales bacterium]
RLEGAGLVRRRPHPDDGRALLVELTEQGAEQAREATEVLNAGVFADPGVPPRRVPTLVGVLRALRKGAGDF